MGAVVPEQAVIFPYALILISNLTFSILQKHYIPNCFICSLNESIVLRNIHIIKSRIKIILKLLKFIKLIKSIQSL